MLVTGLITEDGLAVELFFLVCNAQRKINNCLCVSNLKCRARTRRARAHICNDEELLSNLRLYF